MTEPDTDSDSASDFQSIAKFNSGSVDESDSEFVDGFNSECIAKFDFDSDFDPEFRGRVQLRVCL